mgnify:CR=1 FL=1
MDGVEAEVVSEKQPAKDEKKLKVESIHIKILDDGSFLYEAFSERKNGKADMGIITKQTYSAASIDELVGFLKDDLGSPHIKKAPLRKGTKVSEFNDELKIEGTRKKVFSK